MAWQKLRIEVPEDLTAGERKEAGQAMVDKMVENATNGLGVTGSADNPRRRVFPAYTKDYAKAKGQTSVDLTLSGEMLSALKVISSKKGSVLIGFDSGSEANAKAEGNITGSYGQPAPNKKKARDFLGLLRSEVRDILKEIG